MDSYLTTKYSKRPTYVLVYYKGNPIRVSTNPKKKYMITIDGKDIHFGSADHQHYSDSLWFFSHLDHEDEKKRDAFKKRFEHIRHIENTPIYFSDKFLW